MGEVAGGPQCEVDFRVAAEHDWAAIWPIWQAIVDAGRTYTWPPGTRLISILHEVRHHARPDTTVA